MLSFRRCMLTSDLKDAQKSESPKRRTVQIAGWGRNMSRGKEAGMNVGSGSSKGLAFP